MYWFKLLKKTDYLKFVVDLLDVSKSK